MAGVSPKLLGLLGLVVILGGVFAYSDRGAEDEWPDDETFEVPLAFVDSSSEGPSTTWASPPVTRNPFESGVVAVDPDRVVVIDNETPQDDSLQDDSLQDDGATGGSGDGAANSAPSSPDRTATTLTLEQTIDRRVPPGAPPVTEPPTTDAVSTTAVTGQVPDATDTTPLAGLSG